MSRMYRFPALVVTAAFCLVSDRADAQLDFTTSSGLTVINDRSVFESQFSSVEVEDFESYPTTQNAMLNQDFDFGFYKVRNDFDGVPEIGDRAGHIEFDGGVGSQGLDVQTDAPGTDPDDVIATVTISMIQPVMSFGWDIFSYANGVRPAVIVLDNGEVIDVETGSSGTDFWGIVSDTRFSSLTFVQNDGPTDGFVLDNFTLGEGAVVPEPSHLSILLLTVGGVCVYRRRRKPEMCEQAV